MYGVDEYIRDCHTAQYGIGEEKREAALRKKLYDMGKKDLANFSLNPPLYNGNEDLGEIEYRLTAIDYLEGFAVQNAIKNNHIEAIPGLRQKYAKMRKPLEEAGVKKFNKAMKKNKKSSLGKFFVAVLEVCALIAAVGFLLNMVRDLAGMY